MSLGRDLEITDFVDVVRDDNELEVGEDVRYSARRVGTLTQVLKETKFGVAPTPKSHTSWESGHLGCVNMPRGFPKHEVKHGVEATKRRGAPKRLGCIDMRSAPRLGHVSVPRDVKVDKHMGSFGHIGSTKGHISSFGACWFMKGRDTPKGHDDS
jgi:hypothetical protein